MSTFPILYSFRRCPYAMRARMALWISGTSCELREVKLADKPAELLAASPKGTVPVLHIAEGHVIDESIDIMRWALTQSDPDGWLDGDDVDLIARNDGPFKDHLDRYKYPNRYEDCDPLMHRDAGAVILGDLNQRLSKQGNLCGGKNTLADMATFPFIRQFANHDRDWFNTQPLPHLHDWLNRHLESDIFAAIMKKHKFWNASNAPLTFGRGS